MTQPQKPLSVDDPDSRPLVKTGMTLRRKLVLLAVPTILAVASLPVAIAHAHAPVQGKAAATAVHVTRTAALKHTSAVAPRVAAKAAIKTAATEPVEAADPTTDPAETGTDTGHSDEVAGSTTEPNVDHQFDGQE
jgi:hypothetical protein